MAADLTWLRPTRSALWLIPLAASLMGCGSGGPQLGLVTGEIQREGVPVPGALVEFIPADGKASTGLTDDKGHYELRFGDQMGALQTTHTVQVTPGMADIPAAVTDDSNPMPPPMGAPPELFVVSKQTTVKPGKNEFNFELPTKPQKKKAR